MHEACVNNALAGHALRPYDAPRATAPDAGSAGCAGAAPSAPLSDPFRPLTPTPETPTMAHGAFHWDNPFLLEHQLSNYERMVRDAAPAYCQERLAPRVLENFRHETMDT